MSIIIKTITCPQCGANQSFEDNNTSTFCSYCGSQLVVENNNEHIYRHIDEAELLRAENEKIELLAKMRSNENNNKTKNMMFWIKMAIISIIVIVAVVLMIVGFTNDHNMMLSVVGMLLLTVAFVVGVSFQTNGRTEDGIKLPEAIRNYNSKSYIAIEQILRNAGFQNIQCIPLGDLTTGIIIKSGRVSSISINGNPIMNYLGRFPSDSKILITYHSFPSKAKKVEQVHTPTESVINENIPTLRQRVASTRSIGFNTESELYGQISQLSASIISFSKGKQGVLNSYEFYKLTMEYCLAMEDIAKRSSSDSVKVYLYQSAKKHAMYLRNEAKLSNSASEQMRKACENYDKMIYDIQMK
ncbi:MAG: hypothetical protein IKE53_01940 [Clostridiales bacterium]|nr:hypothetical protein [Clostridiales bacterium]